MRVSRNVAKLISNLTVDANIPMATFKLTGLGAGSASGNSVRYEQLTSLRVKVGTFTNDTGDGSQEVTGVGFEPDIVMVWNVVKSLSLAVYDGTRQLAVIDKDGTLDLLAAVTLQPFTDGSNHIDGAFASLDADGFTITWSGLAGTAPVRTFGYLAIKV